MDLSVPRRCSYPEELPHQPFTMPAPPGMGRTYSANVLTPGVIPSPLNFPSLTPPSSPFYGLYSPSPSQHGSPIYDPSFLRKLKSNPIFRDLQSVLLQECTQMQVPANLITTSWNLMQLDPTSNNNNKTDTNTTSQQGSTTNCNTVYTRHINLQEKILKVRIDPSVSADGLSVENDYSEQVGKIEMDRYRALHSCPPALKDTINSYYDTERLSLADRTESELDKLINKADNLRKSVISANQHKAEVTNGECRSDLSKQLSDKFNGKVDGASLLLQQEEKQNAVRKLQFNTTNDEEDDDYLNCSVNSEDFEIDEIDVETVDKEDKASSKSTNCHHNETSQLQSNLVSQSLPPKSPEVEDLLQKCITESGIVKEEQPLSTSLNNSSTSTDNTSSEGSCTSPMSLDSVKSSSSPDNTSDLHNTFQFSSNQMPDISKFQTVPTNQQSPFSLSSLYQPMKFLPVENINSALSHMQKICSGPSVPFTPESRREFTPNFTPEFTPKMLPLNDFSHNYIPTNYSIQPSPCVNQNKRHSQTAMWTSPFTQPGTSSSIPSYQYPTEQGTSHKPASESRKRKNMCNEVQEPADQKNKNTNQNSSTDVNSNTTSSDGDLDLNNPVFRTHRMLTPEATNILSNWYHTHINYPYPNDEEVEHLSQLTGITGRQVKKWMANKRVRCFNTLSITGNQHPIKYKYKSQGRKKKSAPATSEKENTNCDSTTGDKKPNYSMLTQSAKQILNTWYETNVTNPYPTDEEKKLLAEKCSITISQVQSWFANKRNRTNNTKRQVPNYFLNKHPEYSHLVQLVGHKREETRMIKRRKMNDVMFIQPQFYF